MPANLNLEYNRSSTSLVTAGLLRQTCKKMIPLILAILENLGSSGEKYRPEPDAHDDVVETEAVVDVLLAVAVILLPLCVPVPGQCHF